MSPWVGSGSGYFYTANGSAPHGGTGYVYFGVNNSATGSAYQTVSILEGVVQRGTGTAIRSVGKPVAAKTGTGQAANNQQSTSWFATLSPVTREFRISVL